jgi:hypothetical protein
VHHLRNSTSISSAEFFQCDQVFTAKIEAKLQSDFERICVVDFAIPNRPRGLCITIGRIGGGFRGCIESKTFDILAFQRTSLELVRHGVLVGGELELHKGKVVKGRKEPSRLSDIKSTLPKPMGSEWSERTPKLTAGKPISPCDVLGDADWALRARRFDQL